MPNWSKYSYNPNVGLMFGDEPVGKKIAMELSRKWGHVPKYIKPAQVYGPSRKYTTSTRYKKAVKIMAQRDVNRKLSKQIKKNTKFNESTMGTHVHRVREMSRYLNNLPLTLNRWFDVSSITKLENVISKLKYYDPGNPTLLLEADGRIGAYHKEFLFSRVVGKIRFRTNYKIPVDLKVYLCCVKDDTDQTPKTLMQDLDNVLSNGLDSTATLYPSDYPTLKDLWNIKKTWKFRMEPGTDAVVSYSVPNSFQYDPTTSDIHNLTYQRRYHSFGFLTRMTGFQSHDSSADEHANLPSELDVQVDNTYEIQYNAGADIKFIFIEDDSVGNFTNTGLITNKPVAANQSKGIA